MPRRIRITKSLATDFQLAKKEVGEETVRRLLTKQGGRLLRPERLANIERGTAKLQPWEKSRLNLIVKNRNALGRLQEINDEKGPLFSPKKRKLADSTKKRIADKALRDWMLHGKQAGTDYRSQPERKRREQQKAIKALLYLGVDFSEPDDADIYVKSH